MVLKLLKFLTGLFSKILNIIKILSGLYVGSKSDSQDRFELENKNITHIVSVIEDAKENPTFKVNFNHNNNDII